jgi:hypothetical protein
MCAAAPDTPVRKIADYLKYAEECRRLSLGADTPEHRATLLAMADTWIELAKAREEELARQQRVGKADPKPAPE